MLSLIDYNINILSVSQLEIRPLFPCVIVSSGILPMWYKCVHRLARTTALWDMSGTYRRKYLLFIYYIYYMYYIYITCPSQDEMNCCNLNLIPCTCFCFHFDWKQTQAQLINCLAVSASAVLHCYAELFLSGHQPAELFCYQ